MGEYLNYLIIAGIIIGGLMAIGMIYASLYKKATKEVSWVRTGWGKEFVIKDGGAIVLPVVHEIVPVNMNTMRLQIPRHEKEALITKDRMRVDVTVEIYVRVASNEESIATAAQTLGDRTMDPQAVKEFVEGKFVDVLRSVAAGMDMEELHEKRATFVQRVQDEIASDLTKNGFELESVSLTALDQTSLEFFDENNAFDAQGLTRIKEITESRKKERNDIVQDTAVLIAQKNLEAERQQLNIQKEEENATLQQQREIAVQRAAQASLIAQEQAKNKQEAEETRIAAELATQRKEIEQQRDLEEAEVERQKRIQLAKQIQEIEVANKSQEESKAKAQADTARAEAVKAEEAVSTARQVAAAERGKAIELVDAHREAEKQLIGVTVKAEGEKQAAQDYKEALIIKAQGEAESIKLAADAKERMNTVEADGVKQQNEADNTLAPELVKLRMQLALIEALPAIIEQSVKPMEHIDSIKVVDVQGLTGSSGSASDTPSVQGENLADQVVNSALRYRSQQPLLDSLLTELGISGGTMNELVTSVAQQVQHKAPSPEVDVTSEDPTPSQSSETLNPDRSETQSPQS